MSRILALDIGDARIGVAMSDPLGFFASPLCTIERNKKVIPELLRLLKEQGVVKIIAGYPYELSGAVGDQAKKVDAFLAKLEKALQRDDSLRQIHIIRWDERLTTAQAKRITAGSGLKNRESSAALDRVSAAIILESYMNSQTTTSD